VEVTAVTTFRGGVVEKPIIRALIARKLPNGSFGKSRIVSLATAYIAMRSGAFAVVGPDPDDLIALAAWERAQLPFNQPRLGQ
jgi:hypothetical protein